MASGRVIAALNPISLPLPPPAKEGSLLVRSNVAGAEIMVDGQSKGFTEQANQVRKVPLDQGTYRIQLKKPGYKDSAEQQTEVIANQENQVGFILIPSAGSASVAVLKPSPPAIVSFTASQSKIPRSE